MRASMECIEFSLDAKISKVTEVWHKKNVMSDWNGERNVRGWLARTAVRHLESRTQGEQNKRPELMQRCLALIWPFYWRKDWINKIWSRLLCNMWRLWLYKLSEVTGRRRRRARAEFEKARRSVVLMQRDLKMVHFLCVFLLCTKSYLEMNVDGVWQLQWFTLIHHEAPCCRRFKAAQKIQAPVTQGWCMNSKGVQDNYTLLSHFLLKTRLFRLHSQVCLRNKGWNRWNLPSQVYLVWWPEIRYSTVNQTLTLFSSYEPCFWLQFSGDLCDFSHLELLWAMLWICFETSWGLYVEYYAGRGPGF